MSKLGFFLILVFLYFIEADNSYILVIFAGCIIWKLFDIEEVIKDKEANNENQM